MAATQARQGTHKRRGMISGTKFLVVLVLLALIAVAAIWTLTPPRYRAQTLILVESPFPKPPMQLAEPLVPPEAMDRFVGGQQQLVKDEDVLRDTLKDSAVRATRWFQLLGEQKALEGLQAGLGVTQIKNTNYLAVSFTTKDPTDSAVIVNTVILKYLAKVEAMLRDQYATELQDYEKREKELSDQLQRIRQQKQEFVDAKLAAPGLTEGLNVVGETWRALAAEVAQLEMQKLQHKTVYESLANTDPSQIKITPEMRAMIEQDPQVVQLRDRRLAIELEYQGSLPETAENKAALEKLRKQLDWVERKLLARLAGREDEVRELQLGAAQAAYLNAAQVELQARELMLQAEAKQRDLDHGLANFRSFEEEQLRLEDQLARIRDYMSQLRMVIRDGGMVRVRQIGQAYPPAEPDPRGRIKLTGSAVAVPVLFGLMLLLCRSCCRRAPVPATSSREPQASA